MSSPSSQHGGIFLYILIGIVLFAALGYAVSRNHVKTEFVSDEKAGLLAAEIITQGEAVKAVVSKLRLRGVTETQLSFENSTVSGYANINCNTANCKIFDVGGGGLDWLSPPSGSQISSAAWGFSANKEITTAGTSNKDLIATLPNLSLKVCEQINKRLNVSHMLSQGATTLNKFTGDYNSGFGVTAIGDGNSVAGCVLYPTLAGTATTGAISNSYTFIQTLLIR